MASDTNLLLGISIGAVFSGAKAIAASKTMIDRLGSSIKALEAKKLTLRANSDEYKKAEERIASLGAAVNQLSENNAKLDQIYQKRDRYKAQMMGAVALGYSLYKPIRASIELESAIAGVSKVVDFSEGGLEKFNAQIIDLTRRIPLAASELAQIAAAGGQMGIAEDKIIEFTELTAKMATAFDLSAQETGDVIAKLMNVYNLDIAKTRELGDTINYLTNSMATNPAAVTEIMGRIGGSAKIFGLTTDQAVALSGAFSALGKSPQTAATSINVLLNKLSTAPQQGKEFQEALETIGMDAEQLKDAIENDAQGALNEFLGALQGVEKRDLMGILTNLFGEGFADDMALLVGGMDKYNDALGLVNNTTVKAGAMEREFNTQAATTANQMVILGNAWQESLISIGDALKPLLQAVAWIGTAALKIFNTIFAALGPLKPIITGVVGAFLSLAVVIPFVGYALTFYKAGVINFSNAMIALRASTIANTIATKLSALWTNSATLAQNLFTASLWRARIALVAGTAAAWALNAAMLLNPFVLIGAAIAGAAVLIYKFWNPISEYFGGVWKRIKIVFAPAIKFFSDVIGGISSAFSSFFGWVSDGFSSAWEGIKGAFSTVGEFFSGVGSAISNGFKSGFSVTQSVAGWTWGKIKEIFAPSVDFFGAIVGYITRPFQQFFDWIAEKFNWIKDVIKTVFDTFSFIFGGEDNETYQSPAPDSPVAKAGAAASESPLFGGNGDYGEGSYGNDESGGFGSGLGSYGGGSRNTSVTFGDIYINNSSEAPAVIAQKVRSAVSYELEDLP
jgi:TP901 family phage tail tape measure protein